jgi:nucleotide-binding universal stress UspA family protein
MAGPIICGVDDSESAKEAARIARGLSARLGLRLVFMHVLESRPESEKADVAKRLQRLVADATDADSGAHWVVDVGHPADRLVAATADEGASLLVVGSTGPSSSLMESISADVCRRATCPVVVVPAAENAGAKSDGAIENATGGIVRFGLGSGGLGEPAGGIVRFSFGVASR